MRTAWRPAPLPPEATGVLSGPERWKFWLLTNRVFIGSVLTVVAAAARVAMAFKSHTEAGDAIKGLVDAVLGAGGTVYVAGVTEPDGYHEDEMHAVIRQRSGQYPAFKRRRTDW